MQLQIKLCKLAGCFSWISFLLRMYCIGPATLRMAKANAVVKKKEAVRRGGTQREDSGEVLRFSRSIPMQSPWHATRVHQYRVWKDLHLALGKTLTGWQ